MAKSSSAKKQERMNHNQIEWADYIASLPADERKALAHADALMGSVERKKTEATFVEGEALLLVKQNAQKRTFARWCRQQELDRSSAYKRMDVVEKLADYRTRAIEARVQPSVLLHLGQLPERAEEVLALYESGQRPTVEGVKRLLGLIENKADCELERGGPKGVRLLNDQKRQHISEFIGLMEKIIGTIEEALGSERFVKGQLVGRVVPDARWARLVLQNLGAFIEPDGTGKARAKPFVEGSRWHRIELLLFKMGGEETWPKIDALEPWLREALLLLKWAARGEAIVGEDASQSAAEVSELSMGSGATAEDGRRESELDYMLPPEFAFEGEFYEVLTANSSDWVEAFRGKDVWMCGEDEIHPLQVRLHRELIAIGIGMIRDRYPDMPTHGQEEWLAMLAHDVAAELLFPQPLPSGFEPSDEPVKRVANALLRDFEADVHMVR
jgi:hypothetical protein